MFHLSLQVVEATCQCLLAQAEEGEKEGLDEEEIEHQVSTVCEDTEHNRG
jgi:hypothetical protein